VQYTPYQMGCNATAFPVSARNPFAAGTPSHDDWKRGFATRRPR